jgi:hypothetical protein
MKVANRIRSAAAIGTAGFFAVCCGLLRESERSGAEATARFAERRAAPRFPYEETSLGDAATTPIVDDRRSQAVPAEPFIDMDASQGNSDGIAKAGAARRRRRRSTAHETVEPYAVSGVLLDCRGCPIPHATLHFRPIDASDERRASVLCRTDRLGAFATNLGWCGSVVAIASSKDGVLAARRFEFANDVHELRLIAQRSRTIELRFETPEGEDAAPHGVFIRLGGAFRNASVREWVDRRAADDDVLLLDAPVDIEAIVSFEHGLRTHEVVVPPGVVRFPVVAPSTGRLEAVVRPPFRCSRIVVKLEPVGPSATTADSPRWTGVVEDGYAVVDVRAAEVCAGRYRFAATVYDESGRRDPAASESIFRDTEFEVVAGRTLRLEFP